MKQILEKLYLLMFIGKMKMIKNKTKEEIIAITIDFLKGCAELESPLYEGFCLIDKKIILNKIEQLEKLLK